MCQLCAVIIINQEFAFERNGRIYRLGQRKSIEFFEVAEDHKYGGKSRNEAEGILTGRDSRAAKGERRSSSLEKGAL